METPRTLYGAHRRIHQTNQRVHSEFGRRMKEKVLSVWKGYQHSSQAGWSKRLHTQAVGSLDSRQKKRLSVVVYIPIIASFIISKIVIRSLLATD